MVAKPLRVSRNMAPTQAQEAPTGATTNPLQDEARPLRLTPQEHVPLEEAAAKVAEAAAPTGRPANAELLRRARSNYHVLVEAYTALSAATAAGEAPSPDVEWLLDNFHV